jgi:sugar/nucleoside kinase (ribokinase family)
LAGWKKAVLDRKGTLFTGKLLPGPTALIVSVASDAAGSMAEPFLKVEGITDEFCSLTSTGNAMSRMNATVQKGMDRDYFHYDDEDVNRHSSKVDDVTDDVVEAATADLKKPARSAKKTTKRHKKSKR